MDRYGANFRSERAMAQQAMKAGRNESSCAQKCEVHIIAQSNKAGMDVLTNDISGLLSMALAQQGSGTLGTLRALLGDVILEHLSVSHAMPPQGAVSKHRSEIHDLFVPIPLDPDTGAATGAGAVLAMQRRYVLASLFNGDLEEECITHFCPYGCCATWEETEMRFRTLAPWALLPHKAPRYARQRWTNHGAAVNWSGLLASHHNLLSRLMHRWLGAPTGKPSTPATRVDAESAAFLEDMAVDLGDVPDDAGDPGLNAEGDADAEDDDDATWPFAQVCKHYYNYSSYSGYFPILYCCSYS